jgi:hypothetical protein
MNIFFIGFIKYILANECQKYECLTSEMKPTQSTCALTNSTSNTTYVEPCKKNYICNLNPDKVINECEYFSPYVPGTQTAGTNCLYDQDCVSPNTCVNNKCKGFPENSKCSSQLDCDPGLFCSPTASVCVPQIPIGEVGCFEDTHCVNNAGCQVFSSNDSSVNPCIKYFSINDNEVLQECDSPYSINFLCSSTFCVNSNSSRCYTAPQLERPSPYLCNSDSDCNSLTTGISKLNFSSSCSCGNNPDGNKYCNLLPGDSDFAEYKNSVQKWINGEGILKCNTYGRFGMGCMKTYWDEKSINELITGQYKAFMYPSIANAQDCVLETIYSDYYKSDSYDSSLVNSLFISSLVLILN